MMLLFSLLHSDIER